MNEVMIAGAACVEGKNIAQALVASGLKPILTDSRKQVEQLGQQLLCASYQISPTGDYEELVDKVKLVINLQTPFSASQTHIAKTCIHHNVHYLDLSTDIESQQRLLPLHDEALEAKVMLMPGVGQMPLVLVASMIKTLVKRPSQLTLFHGVQGGDSQRMIRNRLTQLSQPAYIRQQGELEVVEAVQNTLSFELQGEHFQAQQDYWHGALFTTSRDTGVPDIEIYSLIPPWAQRMAGSPALARFASGSLRLWPSRELSEPAIERGKTYIKGIVANSSESRKLSLIGPHPIKWQALCLCAITREILNQHAPAGFQTPSVYGKALLDKAGSLTWLNH